MKIKKTFLHDPDENSETFVNNLGVMKEAMEGNIDAGQAVASMEIARQLDRIANLLEKK